MTYPVYIGDRAAGTMTVTAAGRDTVFELRCPDPEPGLWRTWGFWRAGGCAAGFPAA